MYFREGKVSYILSSSKFVRQAIFWTNADPIHWRIYAALGGDELTDHARQLLPRPAYYASKSVIIFHEYGNSGILWLYFTYLTYKQQIVRIRKGP